MATIWYDRIRDVTGSTGTGTIVNANTPPTNYLALSARYSVADAFNYVLVHQTAAEWEVGVGTVAAANQFSRAAGSVLDGSSGPGVLVNFSAGTKDFAVVMPAGYDLIGVNIQAPLTGATVAMANTDRHLVLNPAGTLAALTITLPATPIHQIDIRSSEAISSLAFTPGWTLKAPPITLAAGELISAIPNPGTTTWFFG